MVVVWCYFQRAPGKGPPWRAGPYIPPCLFGIWGEVLSFGEVRGVLSCVWWLEVSAEAVGLLEQKSDVMLAGVSWAERAEELLTPLAVAAHLSSGVKLGLN